MDKKVAADDRNDLAGEHEDKGFGFKIEHDEIYGKSRPFEKRSFAPKYFGD